MSRYGTANDSHSTNYAIMTSGKRKLITHDTSMMPMNLLNKGVCFIKWQWC